MRAVIVATGGDSEFSGLGPGVLTPMLPLGDRPFLQHIFERMVLAGYRRIAFVLGDGASQVERHFGDGRRWGCSIEYHLTVDHMRAAGMSATLGDAGEPFLLAQGDVLPLVPLNFSDRPAGGLSAVLRTAGSGGDDAVHGDWTGWAWITPEIASTLKPDTTWASLAGTLTAARDRGAARDLPVDRVLSARTPAAYLGAQRLALGELSGELQFEAFPCSAGIWIGRGVRMPSSVELIPPVLIGDYCKLGERLTLGPAAVIGAGCVIDDQSSISDSVVLPGSYIGRFLEVRSAIVQHNRLYSVKLAASVDVQDAFVLGVVQSERTNSFEFWSFPHTIARIFSLFLAPLAGVLAASRFAAGLRPVFHRKEFLARPREPDGRPAVLLSFVPASEAKHADRWRHFWLVFLPGLLNVAAGSVRVVGLPPRSRLELQELPADWRDLAQEGFPGLLSESFVLNGTEVEDAVQFASEAYCAVHSDWRISWKVLAKYVMLLCLGRPSRQSGV